MMRVAAAIICAILAGSFLGAGMGICVNAHWSPLWAVPGTFALVIGVIAGAWSVFP